MVDDNEEHDEDRPCEMERASKSDEDRGDDGDCIDANVDE